MMSAKIFGFWTHSLSIEILGPKIMSVRGFMKFCSCSCVPLSPCLQDSRNHIPASFSGPAQYPIKATSLRSLAFRRNPPDTCQCGAGVFYGNPRMVSSSSSFSTAVVRSLLLLRWMAGWLTSAFPSTVPGRRSFPPSLRPLLRRRCNSHWSSSLWVGQTNSLCHRLLLGLSGLLFFGLWPLTRLKALSLSGLCFVSESRINGVSSTPWQLSQSRCILSVVVFGRRSERGKAEYPIFILPSVLRRTL